MYVGAETVDDVEGSTTTPQEGEAEVVPPGSESQAACEGSPRNLGDPVVSTGRQGPWEPSESESPTCAPWLRQAARGKHWRYRWYLQAKATKCGGTGGGESERLVRPLKLGNPLQGTQWRKGGARDMDPLEGTTWGHRPLKVSYRDCNG